ncbi:ribonuclease inhibitor [Novosphingobium sp.]|uniref:ribonuclease inhibitor n=1 Tax=Novosphingobium sp. TaxID=1874826 RepID=UPI0028ABBCC7|nr:ribonuclease inhibitor [Novosphingobium sp.]
MAHLFPAETCYEEHGSKTEEPMEQRQFEIEGSRIADIPSFYAEINRLLMADESWQLAESLDALNDVRYGGYGAIQGREPVRIVWKDMSATKSALGRPATSAFLKARLATRTMFNGRPIVDQLAAFENGEGATYFDVIMEVFSEHPNIEIVPA